MNSKRQETKRILNFIQKTANNFLDIFDFLVRERVSSAGPSGGDEEGCVDRRDILMDRGSFGGEKREYFFRLLFFEGLFFGLLNKKRDT